MTGAFDGVGDRTVDPVEVLVVPRVLACVIALPLLTLIMDFSGLVAGFVAEYAASGISWHLYIERAFASLDWANFVPPTLKTAVFGFIIGAVSSYFGYTTSEGAQGVGKAATNSVVLCSLLIIVSDVVLVQCIAVAFPRTAL